MHNQIGQLGDAIIFLQNEVQGNIYSEHNNSSFMNHSSESIVKFTHNENNHEIYYTGNEIVNNNNEANYEATENTKNLVSNHVLYDSNHDGNNINNVEIISTISIFDDDQTLIGGHTVENGHKNYANEMADINSNSTSNSISSSNLSNYLNYQSDTTINNTIFSRRKNTISYNANNSDNTNYASNVKINNVQQNYGTFFHYFSTMNMSQKMLLHGEIVMMLISFSMLIVILLWFCCE